MTPLNLPNCPSTGLKRKITGRNFLWFDDEDLKQIIIDNKVSYFKADDTLVSTITRRRKLVATLDTQVNPVDGSFLTPEQVQHNKTYDQQLATYNTAHEAWQNLPPEQQAQTPEPQAPAPKHPAMGEYDYYVLVIGASPVNLPQLLDMVTLARVEKFENIL